MSKRKKDSKEAKKEAKKAKQAAAAPRATTGPRMLSEQKESVLVTAEDGSPLFVVKNVLLNTQCPELYNEGSLALFGTYTVVQPKKA
jgi:hypothetical protein